MEAHETDEEHAKRKKRMRGGPGMRELSGAREGSAP